MTASSTKELLDEAHELSMLIDEESSLELQSIKDGDSGQIIRPWRSIQTPRDLPLHRMMSRVGGFPPALVRYFIGAYSRSGDVILDPFCGKGTTLLEAAVAGRRAVGGDISPEAVISARAKTYPITAAEAANYVQNLPTSLSQVSSDIPASVSLFFQKDTLKQLLAVRKQLLEDMQNKSYERRATFLCGVLLGLLHGHSALSLSLPCNQVFAMSPGYVRRYVYKYHLRRPKRDVISSLLQKALEFLPFPQPLAQVDVFESPADQCHLYMKGLELNADVVITSPPYLDRQTYIKDAWLRLWFLGRNACEITKPSLETGNVGRFVEGMRAALESISRSVRKRGSVVLVCGRAKITVGGEPHSVRVSDLCLLANSKLAQKWRLKPERLIIDRKIMKRGSYFAVHHGKFVDNNGNHGRRFGEDEILVFKKA